MVPVINPIRIPAAPVACAGMVIAFCLALTGCSASPADGNLGSPTSPAAAAYDPAGVTWFSGPADMEPMDEQDDAELGPDEPGPTLGPEAPAASASAPDPVTAAAADKPAKPLDVCALIGLKRWRGWSGSGAASAVETEPGEECVFLEPADQVRARLAVAARSPRTLNDEDKAMAETVGKLNPAGFWLTGKPTPFGGTMVVELPLRDVVIEVYSRDPARGPDDLKSVAEKWATLVIGALG